MSIIVTDHGFTHAIDEAHFTDIASDTPPDALNGQLSAKALRIDFPSFADGRGFTLARRLRELGFKGHIRAKGHVLADQYAMARRCGFDDVEISDDLAKRQPEPQWQARANWAQHHYQERLRGQP